MLVILWSIKNACQARAGVVAETVSSPTMCDTQPGRNAGNRPVQWRDQTTDKRTLMSKGVTQTRDSTKPAAAPSGARGKARRNRSAQVGGPRPNGALAAVAEMAPEGRRRLQPDVREQMILDKATQFFATHGFSGQIRELARYVGISPALVFKYFGNKQNLIERVYRKVFIERWDDTWERQLANRKVPLRERLKRFYREFFEKIDDFGWTRCGLLSSFEGGDLSKRHVERAVIPILNRIVLELRHERGIRSSAPPSERELETVWHLHSTFVYYAVRKHVHRRPVWENHDDMAEHVVSLFLGGIAALPSPEKSGK